jgi:ribokinase
VSISGVTRRTGRIVTLGDALVDVVVEADRPPVVDDDVPARIRLAVGGQAANVASWTAYLGAPAAVITVLGVDPAGEMVRGLLHARGVAVLGRTDQPATGTVVSLVSTDGRRTMLSDREPGAPLRGADLQADWFLGAAWLHISGYALFGPGDPEAALAAASLAHRAGTSVSVDLSAATLLADLGLAGVRARLQATRADVVFGNEAEVDAAGPLEVATYVVKHGGQGCRVVTGADTVRVAAAPATVRDTTGAGDAFAAGWLIGGPDLAARTAATCVERPGAMPPLGHDPQRGAPEG